MDATPDTHRAALRIPATHPALPGHFPGEPVVPGVLLLARVIAAAEQAFGIVPAALDFPQVKFLATLPPEEDACIELERRHDRIRFRIVHGETVIAHGDLTTKDAT
ncbi:hydroxymyristoyl-ACP dehydratase [Coralloluteibacterium thermophilus]|uniref:Hydroxymyristoyl-ACP dehydratase n=1 Tax=Coralloluteibacterium thermophilum TaxID=2707049 RepID=A0ABV9NGD7_9GAMM